jgi:small subunit ribosomal protein S5
VPPESRTRDLVEKVIKIRRCAAVVKGGRRFSFNGMVVVGNGRGKVGWGYGKANEVPPAVDKAVKDGERSMIEVPLEGNTISHPVLGHFGACDVVMLPASAGTGVIAGAAVRAVCEAVGIHDVLTKVYGSTNPINVAKATIDALKQLRTRPEVERLRGVSLQ